jgi:hypothetical protein
MMNEEESVIVADSISGAWLKAISVLLASHGEVPLLMVRIDGFDGRLPSEDPFARAAVDRLLGEHNLKSISTTSNTIFPSSLWNESLPRERLYQRYKEILPRLRKMPLNQYGIYFERMIAYGWDAKKPESIAGTVNQLESIIQFYLSGNHRRSLLQLAVLDPKKDLVNQPRRPFPCLQQVSFCPDGPTGWAVTGYYPTQYIIDRGYGHYLGLAKLGDFVATSVGRRLTRIACVTNVAKLGDGASVAEIKKLLSDIGAAT